MREAELQRLYTVTQEMEKRWKVDISSEEEQILPGEYRTSCIEHCCHELGHAFLLGVPLGPKLAERVGAKIKERTDRRSSADFYHSRDWNANDVNEIQTFAATIMALEMMGFVIDDMQAFTDACAMQTSGTHQDLLEAFRRSWTLTRVKRAAKRMVRVFNSTEWFQ